MRAAWPIVEPAAPLLAGWHVDAIADHLEAVARGQIKRLLINIPPGHAKSLIVSVLWPAWVWTWRPAWRSLFASYAKDLALRDSTRCRSVITSPWYVEQFSDPGGWMLLDDSNRKSDFGNTASGRRLSTSVDGAATGERGNAIVVDDPINVKDAHSKLEREKVIRWWDVVMSSRLNNLIEDSKVIIMQRLHEGDLAGHVLRQGGYEHLRLPSEFNPAKRATTSIGWTDPRTDADELLFPALFPPEALAQARRSLGPDGYAGQHQQEPTPEGGGMFKAAWWRFWKPDGTAPDHNAQRPEGCYQGPALPIPRTFGVTVSVDCAFRDLESSDYVVATAWVTHGTRRFVLDMVRGKFSFTRTCEEVARLAAKHKALRVLVEGKANGDAVVDRLRGKVRGMITVDPEGGKEARASAMQPDVEAGDVYLPDGAPWLADWVAEFSAFPRGEHDDIVDSASQFMNYAAISSDVSKAVGLAKL